MSDLAARLAAIPYARYIGMGMDPDAEGIVTRLPFEDHLVGNHRLNFIHGGVLGAFLEMTALITLSAQPLKHQPRTIDITIEYIRPGRAITTFGRAEVRKLGRRIANVHAEAWQDNPAAPIAFLRGHFTLSPEA